MKKELQFFLDHKVPQVKFVDRTFNCKHDHSIAIWKYIMEHDNGITNFHFEIAADILNEEELERGKYKIIFRFNDDGTVTLSAPDPDIHFNPIKNPTWKLAEKMDVSLPYLKHKTITIEGFKYEFDDVTSVPGTPIRYVVEGTVNMERKINIQIPDEDQAIEW